jgi:hypothetical protein
MVENGFEIFVTIDGNLPYQQNLKRLPLTIFIRTGVDNRKETLATLIPTLLDKPDFSLSVMER